MLTIEQRTSHFIKYVDKLKELGIDTETLIEKYGDKLKDAPLSDNANFGMAYEGALIYQTLWKLTPYALKINEMFPEKLRANKESIIKVCLLANFSKIVMFERTEEKWKNDKGIYWAYTNFNLGLRSGERSFLMCKELGINFTDEEYEAIVFCDKQADDTWAKQNSSVLTTVIRMATEMMWLEANKITKLKNE